MHNSSHLHGIHPGSHSLYSNVEFIIFSIFFSQLSVFIWNFLDLVLNLNSQKSKLSQTDSFLDGHFSNSKNQNAIMCKCYCVNYYKYICRRKERVALWSCPGIGRPDPFRVPEDLFRGLKRIVIPFWHTCRGDLV